MFVSNIEEIPGKRIMTCYGIVSGSTVRAKHVGRDQAQQLGANAIVNVRFSTSSVAAGAAEIYVYGTAVTVA
jgi:uncharacterized protein YbjQ (UPF0145 family)